jgi:tetratricopeptide (TPR) repeat protein
VSKNFAQNVLEKQYQLSFELYKQEKYFDTITELKRLIFFDTQAQYAYRANSLIARSYKMGGHLQEAIIYFNKALLNASADEELFEAKLEIIKINILRRTTDNALRLLDHLDTQVVFEDRYDQINFWRGWAYIFNDDWESASSYFNKISPNHEMKILCDQVDSEKSSVTFAKLISFIVPGSGQFYTGNYLNGFLSLGWNLLFGYLTIDAFSADRVFDGLVVANFLWLRFYSGNIQNAEKFAIEKNIEISNRALEYLQYEYEGVKP